MKKLIISITILSILFLSCSKKKDDVVPATKNTIIATIDGTKATYPSAVALNGYSSFSGLFALNVVSSVLFPNTIDLLLQNPTDVKPGTYTNTAASTVFYIHYQQYSTYENRPSGTITISSISATNVKGTFSGDVYDFETNTTKSITNGSFDVDF